VPLSIESRFVGDVVVLGCSGRLVEGAAVSELEARMRDLMEMLHRYFVLDVADVSFLDSAGLGLLVRLLSRVRAAGGDLKLCRVPQNIQKALQVTRLESTLSPQYRSDAEAIAAMHRPAGGGDTVARDAVHILCVHPSTDVLAYLQRLLRQAGYDAVTTTNRSDALTLLRATTPSLLVIEAAAAASLGGVDGLPQNVRGHVRMVQLPEGFSTTDPAVAAPQLLAEIARALAVKP
jgi:anti-sigma B factor antagonist